MGVPEDIRKVERPRNTVVVDRGGNGPLRWAVIERTGCKRDGARCLPVSGGTVGHIVDGRYVAARPNASARPADVLGWADAAAADRAGAPLLDELREAFSSTDALKIYCLAVLRVIEPGIAASRASEAYASSWLSVLRPGAALSKNTVGALLEDVGRSYSSIVSFMRKRAAAVAESHRVAVDSTLKTDESKSNTLAHYSRKARVKGTRDISVVYAFDADAGEPVCAKVFPGNVVDEVAYGSFLEETQLKRGILIGDKAFRKGAAEGAFEGSEGLHWLNPLKRGDKRIAAHSMYDWQGALSGAGRDVLYKKEAIGDCFLYGFYDRARAAKEEADHFSRMKKAKGGYDKEKEDRIRGRFGTVVFESDLDLDPEAVWRMYEKRWLVEVTFRYYKQVLDLDDTRVHSDCSVYGSELVNFVSTCITMRLVAEFEEAGLLDKMTYSQVMADLAGARRVRLEEGGEWVPARVTKRAEGIVRKLGLDDGQAPAKPKRGRPRKAQASDV